MKTYKKVLALLLVFTVLFVPFGEFLKVKAAPAKGNTLYIPTISDPIELCPFNSTDSASSDVSNLIYRGLLKPDFSLKFVPDLAASMPTFSKDNLKVTFKLKTNLKWEDGQPLTADDVKFSFDFIMHPDSAAPRAGDVLDMLKSVAVKDKYTVEFTLNKAKELSQVLSFFTARYIVPKHLWEKIDPKDNMTEKNIYNKKPVGCGPYKFVEWLPNERVVLERNPYYEDKKPNIEKIVFKNVGSTANQMIQLQTQEGDVAGIPPTDVQNMRAQKHLNIYQYDRFSIELITFNTKSEFFQDKKVRQAINYAINKQAIINGIYKGIGRPAYSMYFPGTEYFNANVKKYDYNLALAKKLLDEAGWKVGKDGIREKNGKKFIVTLCTNKGNITREKAAVIVQSQLKLVGIKVETRVVEWNTFITKYLRPKKFDLYYGGWLYSDWVQDLTAIYHSDPSKGNLNYGSFTNKELDKLMENAVSETDPAKAKAMHLKIQEILADEVPSVYLLYGRATLGVNKRISNVKYVNGLGINYDYRGWTIKE